MELQNPCGVFETEARPLTPRRPIDSETTVGLLVNDKKNADVLAHHLERALTAKAGIGAFRWLHKEAVRPADLDDAFVADCDVVAAAVGD